MHTHSLFCDGNDHPHEMTETAIAKGFDILGFSGHGFSPFDECSMTPEKTAQYIETVTALKQEYQDRITLYLGIEEDMTNRISDESPYDFVIGSVHFLKKNGEVRPIDASRAQFDAMLEEWYSGDFCALAEDYYREVSHMKDCPEVHIIGHLDLLMKYSEQTHYISPDDPRYLRLAEDCIHALGTDKIYEVNTGAIARGYRSTPYPSVHLLQILHSVNAKLMLNSDCHDRRYLDCGFAQALALIRKTGFQELYILKNGEYLPVSADEFH